MNQVIQWIRVSKMHPCAICGKPDWCTTSEKWHCCMRVKSQKQASNGGYLHECNEKRKFDFLLDKKEKPKPLVGLEQMFAVWRKETEFESIANHADQLGVDAIALASTGIAWHAEKKAWAFPMRDALGNYIGVRFRRESGFKFSMTGSKSGLFYPDEILKQKFIKTTYIVEGPSDLAAMLTLDNMAIARPSCLGCEQMVVDLCKRANIKNAIIIADNDIPGIAGAKRLLSYMKIPSTIYVTPKKDLRDSLAAGLTLKLIQFAVAQKIIKQNC